MLVAADIRVLVRRLAREPPVVRAGKHPNIVFLLTDDLDMHELAYMPNVRRLLADQGVTFTHYYVSVSLCCPVAFVDSAGPVLAQHRRADERRRQRRLRDGVPPRDREVDDRHVAAECGLPDRLHRQVPERVSRHRRRRPTCRRAGTSSTAPSAARRTPNTTTRSTRTPTSSRTAAKPRDYGTTCTSAWPASSSAAKRQAVLLYLNVYAPHQPATPAPPDAQLLPDGRGTAHPGVQRVERGGQAALAAPAPRVRAHERIEQHRRSLPRAASGRCRRSTAVSPT